MSVREHVVADTKAPDMLTGWSKVKLRADNKEYAAAYSCVSCALHNCKGVIQLCHHKFTVFVIIFQQMAVKHLEESVSHPHKIARCGNSRAEQEVVIFLTLNSTFLVSLQ